MGARAVARATLLERAAGIPPTRSSTSSPTPRVVETRRRDARRGDLRIVQFPRAEADVAVAAASILAREAFVDWLDRAEDRIGIALPKGASPAVIAAAQEIVADAGRGRARHRRQAALRHHRRSPGVRPFMKGQTLHLVFAYVCSASPMAWRRSSAVNGLTT